MRLITIIGFSVILILASLYQSLALLVFQSSQELIATEYCEQKELKDNSCQGACVLKELLKATPEKEQSPALQVKLELDELFANSLLVFSSLKIYFSKSEYASFYQTYPLEAIVYQVWHPPKITT